MGEIHYNLDQSVVHLTENNLSKGISHQQYVINYANVLADLLSESLTNMQKQMSQLGSGKANPSSGEPQLSDIIVKQQEIEQKFKEHLQPGKTNPNPEGENPDESEAEMGALLEIYKEQQRLREALQKALEQQPKPANFVDPSADIKKLEQNLLNKGFSEDLLNQFNNLQHQLLQLQDAVKEQGESAKREGQTNTIKFSSPNTQIPKSVIDYINSTEMLQKNSLPLQNKYEELVKEYFK